MSLLQENRSFVAHLKKIGLPHIYREFPGGHNWPYWDEHIQEGDRVSCAARSGNQEARLERGNYFKGSIMIKVHLDF